MYQLEGKTLRYRIDEYGRCASFYNKLTCHEYIHQPDSLWKIIYAVHNSERVEVPIWSGLQAFTVTTNENQLVLTYEGLVGDDQRKIDATLNLYFLMTDLGLKVKSALTNRDPEVELIELQLTPVSGARSLSGSPETDYIAWPQDLGKKVRSPAYCDLSSFAGFRKYERHDQFHTDMDALYQGRSSMQWYDWHNQEEGLYCASEDTTRQALCLHIERDVKSNILRFGFIRYPMISQGETWEGHPLAFYPHIGDWHAGAKFYRSWMDREGGFTPPIQPEWCKDFTGWLRVILKQHHCETNWDYSQIPALYDETEAAGFKTLYLLGWEKGGFARMWPDFIVDDDQKRLGDEQMLRKGIEYVHNKGGKVVMFLSYALIDHQSHFYKHEGGDRVPIKSIWNEEIPFSETYCGEGTYRKIANPAMPMYLACPGAPLWQEKMKDVAKTCFDLGADGVLYDIGGMTPYFCYDENHTHQKPSHSHESKAANYAGLREYVKSFGEDKIIMMEHNIDIYGQHMDIAHGGSTIPDKRLLTPNTAGNPEDAKDDTRLLEMYRYTFPEIIVTNRECGQDEVNFKAMAGYSFLLGLRFDMTIYRCCGSLSDIPNYTAYLKELNTLYQQYGSYLLRGTFIDTDGFTNFNKLVFAKGWKNTQGSLAVTLWNPTGEEQQVKLETIGGQKTRTVMVPAQLATVVEL